VKKTYNFRDLHIPAAERAAKEKELDQFWTTVKAKKQAYLPCLVTGVKDPNSNPFFRFDGSNLLVEIDPSLASKTVQADVFMATDIDMVGARRWVTVLSYRGFDGIDISKAAEHWLDGVDKNTHYTLPEHGDFEVGPYEGGLFLYGSMEEEKATASLLKIVNQANHPNRELALALLTMQVTPESLAALKKVNVKEFSAEAQEGVKTFLTKPPLIVPRTQPKTTRAEFVHALQELIKGHNEPFFGLMDKVPDGEKDLVAVMKSEDLPLLRKARRLIITGCTQHSIGLYSDFTRIILTFVWKPTPKP
jgi:hypothetical protein